MAAPTWRALWHRLRDVLRLRRVRFRYCADCGMTLTADETVTCVECIERKQAAWTEMPADPNVLAQFSAALNAPPPPDYYALLRNMALLEQQHAMQRPPTGLGHLGAICGGLLGGMPGGGMSSRALGGQQRPWWEC